VRRTLVLLAALSTVMIACGDDDDSDDPGAAPTAEGGTAAGDGDDYCTALTEFKASREQFATLVASGTATPEEIQAAITAESAAFSALLDTAPADIQDDMGAIAGPTDSFIEALDEVDYDVGSLTTDNAAVAEALNQLDGPNYIESTESVDAYGLENCGITIGDWRLPVP
jgi:hypothetical protein